MITTTPPQFFVASVVYYVTSVLFPARETYVDKLISADNALPMGALHGSSTSPIGTVASCKDAEKTQGGRGEYRGE